jgi:uncharacterized damage-inducible protein DinB
MANEDLTRQLQAIRTYFEKTVSCFQPADGTFAPHEGMFTVAQQISHAAHTVEWFLEGAFRPDGMNLDFAAHEAEVRAIDSLEDAMAWWSSALQEAHEFLEGSAPESWDEPIRGQLMAGMPRRSILGGINDHTAHHRGALSVYARLLEREPPMPYGA